MPAEGILLKHISNSLKSHVFCYLRGYIGSIRTVLKPHLATVQGINLLSKNFIYNLCTIPLNFQYDKVLQ